MDPSINVVTRSGAETGRDRGAEASTSGEAHAKKDPLETIWIRKAPGKAPPLNLQKNKEIFIDERDTFREPADKSSRIPLRSETLHVEDMPVPYDKTSTATDVHTSVAQFLQSCMKLLKSENAIVELQKLINQYEPQTGTETSDSAVHHIRKHK